MSPVTFDPNNVSDEEYLVLRAKSALPHDPYSAKAWMITAKTLFPNNFGVQFEAYQIEKSARSVKEAAKCFSEIFKNFPDEKELWKEIQALTTALRSDNGDANCIFLRDMFSHIPQDVQRELLLMTADRSEDTMEHCRLLLLLLRQFPRSIVEHGPRLVDTLMTAEKHSHYQNSVNCYRKLLVCDLLPLLGSSMVELPAKQLFRLLHKSIEFYLAYLMLPNQAIEDLPDLESKIDDPWKNLFTIQEMTGKKLGWELSAISALSWSKDAYWQKVLQFRQATALRGDDPVYLKQLLYCTATFFLFCLHEYVISMETGIGEMPLVLVEAFCSPSELDDSLGEPKAKRRKIDLDEAMPLVTVAKPPAGHSVPPVVHNYLMAVRCWDLLHSSEVLEREFTKLSQHLRLNNSWLQGFLIDTAIYKGKFKEAIEKIQSSDPSVMTDVLQKSLRLASSYHSLGQHSACLEHVLQIVSTLPVCVTPPSMQLSLALQQFSRSGRHLHYLPMHRSQILQYCVKLLVSAFKQSLVKQNVDADLIMGHIFTLLQFDWPLEEDLALQLLERIRQNGCFSYSLFQTYIVNIDLLEEFMYLSTEQGGSIGLDVIPSSQTVSQRRISTRGVDKGVKEDFKLAMKRQACRSDEPLDVLIIKFLNNERELLLHSLQ